LSDFCVKETGIGSPPPVFFFPIRNEELAISNNCPMAPHCPVRIDFRLSPTRANPKCSGAEGFQRAIGKPFGRLRRGETLCSKQCNAMQNQKLIIIDFII
jgi:hypothetical protein